MSKNDAENYPDGFWDDDDDDDDAFDNGVMDMLMGGNPFDEAGYWQAPDYILSDIVSLMVNLQGLEFGVTFFLKGIVMTGILVSENEYLKALTDLFVFQAKNSNPTMSQEDIEQFRQSIDFTNLNEWDFPSAKEIQDGANVEVIPLRFVHLKNPAIITPQPMISFHESELPILRLRLALIDGWLPGRAVPFDYDGTFPDGSPPDEIIH